MQPLYGVCSRYFPGYRAWSRVYGLVIVYFFSWNEFLFANLLSGSTVRTAPVGLNEYATPVSVLWGQIGAAGTMIVLPVAIITIILQRKMVRGLTMGAVKG